MPLNHDAFATLTKESAYLLGLITSDGNIIYSDKPWKRWNISIGSTDIEIVNCFKRIVDTPNKIVEVKPRKKVIFPQGNICNCKRSYQIKIDSRKIYEDLTNIGLMPNKSLKLQEIHCPDEIFSHFLRGVFDGDGSISIRKNRRDSAIFTIASGSELFLKWLNNKITKLANLNKKLSLSKSRKIYNLKLVNREELKKLIRWMYQDSNILTRLSRKYKICEKVLTFTQKKGMGQYDKRFKSWKIRVNGVLLPSYKSQEEVLKAKEYFLETGKILDNNRVKKYEAYNESKTLQEWQKDPRCEVRYDTLRRRINNKIPLEIALKKPRQPRRMYE